MAVGMKKVFVTAPSVNGVTTDKEGVGTPRYDGNIIYKWVKFTGTTAVNAGDPVYYIAGDLTLTQVDAAVTNVPAGISTAAQASGTVWYGWILIDGIVTLSNTPSGTVAVGTPLGVGSTAGTLAAVAAAGKVMVATSVDGTKTAQAYFPL